MSNIVMTAQPVRDATRSASAERTADHRASRTVALLIAAAMPLVCVSATQARSSEKAAMAGAIATEVQVANFTFSPATLTIPAGTTVTWLNADDIPHTIVAKDRSFRSKALDTDGRFSFTFTASGEYDYFCSLHPHMTGRIVVAK